MHKTHDKILLVDDDADMLGLWETVLHSAGYIVMCAASAEEALKYLAADWFSLLISDLYLPGIDGLALLKQAKMLKPTMPIIVLTAHGTVESAVAAMKHGAYDYLAKPVDQELLQLTVKKALEFYHLTGEVERLRKYNEQPDAFKAIIGRSPAIQALLKQVRLVAPSNSTILIQGESGTGKELIARAIHYHSPRRDGVFIPLDCGTLSESLLESELFGHRKGAFTGAIHNKKGLFEEANGSTLFLDEVADTTLLFQSKLLRVLQESEVRPVGTTKAVPVDVRVIAATNKDLKQAVQAGTFRGDLYYRLAVVPLVLPPLRQRREDIPLLVNHFVQKYCRQNNLPCKCVSVKALRLMIDAPWPGNIRELENVIERAVLLNEGAEITPEGLFPFADEDLGQSVSLADTSRTLIEMVEREKIRHGLHQAKGVRSYAAKLLGISRATLYTKLRRYNLDHEIYTE